MCVDSDCSYSSVRYIFGTLHISKHLLLLEGRCTVLFDDISERQPACSRGVERSDDRGSEGAGRADTEGHRTPARPLGRLLLKAGVGEHQPNLPLAYITVLEQRQLSKKRPQGRPIKKPLHETRLSSTNLMQITL